MENKIQIFHNQRCSKSREALGILNDYKKEVEIVDYLKIDLSEEYIKDVLNKLKISAFDLLRKGEADYKENVKGKDLSEEDVILLMVKYPKLIERPIVINGDKAIVGRPPSIITTVF